MQTDTIATSPISSTTQQSNNIDNFSQTTIGHSFGRVIRRNGKQTAFDRTKIMLQVVYVKP